MTKKKIYKAAIAGFGIVGKRRYECIQANKNVEVIGVCDKKFKKEFMRKNNLNYYKNYKKMFENENIDLVIICMTNDIAPEVTIQALRNNLHVFCEKPPGRNLKDIELVIREEKKYPNLKLMYGFNHRYHESVQSALKIIKSKRLGKIINMRGVYGKSKLITFNQPTWRTKRKIAGGGVLLDQGIHMLDLMRYFGGEFIEVKSFISNSHWGFDVEDNAYAIMKTKDNKFAMINSSATQWRHLFNLDINLSKGSIILSGILSSSKSYGSEKLTLIEANPRKDNTTPKEKVFRYNEDKSWDKELQSFVNSIKYNKIIQNGSSYDALQSMRLVYKVYWDDKIWRKKFKIKSPGN